MYEIVINVLNEHIAELCAINIEEKTNYHCEIRKVFQSDWNTKVQSLIDFIDSEFPDGCGDIKCTDCILQSEDKVYICDYIQNRGKK